MERELMTRAWSNLLQVLEKVRAEGEKAFDELAELDAKRRVGGRIIEGNIAEYCRCGKKDCPDLGKPGHSIRYHLQTTAGAVNIPKKQIDTYRQALEFNAKYHQALRAIKRYEQICERSYRALGYIGRGGSFQNYLKSFS